VKTFAFNPLKNNGAASQKPSNPRRRVKSAHIECATDRAAVDVARDHTGDFEVIEIWDGGRFICGCGNPHEGSPG
jgi:hypothetical protein